MIVLAAVMLATIAQAQNSATVMIQSYSFQPGDVTIEKGGTVTWMNQDSIVHDVKFKDSDSPELKKGDMYTKTFSQPGTYDYFCDIHPSMKGKVVVK